MITGNFALLAGYPDEIDAWYLGIYIDAIEWVEITNTRGMSQFADGGIVGTKPYVSSASYIDKMSHYCGLFFLQKRSKQVTKPAHLIACIGTFMIKTEEIRKESTNRNDVQCLAKNEARSTNSLTRTNRLLFEKYINEL
jgi:deoxyribodipyrimidine photolyase-related protein